MFKNYFTVAFRNFRRNKLFSLINILGLSIGISAALVIFLIVHYDFSFDRFEKNGDHIYRVVSQFTFQGNTSNYRGIPAPLEESVRKELSGLDEVAAFRYYNAQKLAVPGAAKPSVFKNQTQIVFADNHYFNLLPYKWLAGSPRSALNDPGRVVLTETRAKLYFPTLSYTDLIGRQLIYDDTIITTVSGVVQDLDRRGNTNFSFQEFISLPTVLDNKGLRVAFSWDDWGSVTSDQQLYVRLSGATKPASVEAGLKNLVEKYLGEGARKNHITLAYFLQPLSDIHFNGLYGTFDSSMADKPTLYGLILVAIFLLLLGCINFINLTTAQASQRAKEIGIRKTMGSSKAQLILQFLSETLFTTVVATGLSLALTPLLLNVFAGFIPDGLHFSLRQPYLLVFLALLVPIVSLLAGSYPALVLSSWQPIQVLKNQAYGSTGKTRKVWIRQTLTVSQFVIAQAFIMATLLVSKQIRFLLNEDLGFRKEAILGFSAPYSDTSYARRIYLLHEAQNIPGVVLASLGNDLPSSGGSWNSRMLYRDGKKEVQTAVELKYGDVHYLQLFHIPLLAGRNVQASDTTKEMLINETYLHILGFRQPQDALGKTLTWDNKEVPIVGVMKDFHAHPLNDGIKPMAFSTANRDCHELIIALHSREAGVSGDAGDNAGANDWQATIAGLEKTYKNTYPGEAFNYAFFDESLANAYGNEQNISKLLTWATGLTVFISCLGLLGLVIYTTNHRSKEIGVRKVLGASVAQIVSILSKDFVKLVAIGFILATPLAWWALHKWLENYAFRTTMSWWVFILSGLGMILVALITLSVQTIRAATANPVRSLRTE